MAPTAAAAILCGDPARALAIAQHVLTAPRMCNHHRGLWGYHGTTSTGAELTVHATGIGGPSAALVLEELAGLGLERAIRVGTCRALGPAHSLGDPLLIAAALAGDGTSAALGFAPGRALPADPALTAQLRRRGEFAAETTVRSADIRPEPQAEGSGAGGGAPEATVADLQSAALIAAGAVHGTAVAVTLVVTGTDRDRLEDDPLEAATLKLADSAADVLAGAVDAPISADEP